MDAAMNRAKNPTFPVPTWTLARESRTWEKGIPDSIALIKRPGVCGGNSALTIFATKEAAATFISEAKLGDMRPLAISNVFVFIATLNSFVRNGLKFAVCHFPDVREKSDWEFDAETLLNDLIRESRKDDS
jgi:hypothetical protein